MEDTRPLGITPFGIPDDKLYEALRRCETRNRDRGRITGQGTATDAEIRGFSLIGRIPMIHEDRWKSTSEALDRLADERHGKLRERLDGATADCDAEEG